MNRWVLVDRLFKTYRKLPHCRFCRKRHIQMARSRFDYDNLNDISIFSTNCIGGEIYSLLGLPFRSPLINASMDRRAFIKLCASLHEYLALPLRVERLENGSCLGRLGGGHLPDIEMRFVHGTDPQAVKADWERRCRRVNYQKLVLIVDDRGLNAEDLALYNTIPALRKICLMGGGNALGRDYEWCCRLPAYAGQPRSGKYHRKSLDGLWEFTKIWDYVAFLNGEPTQKGK